MPILVELNPSIVGFNEDKYPNKDRDSFIYEHLKHFLSKDSQLPSISIFIEDANLYVNKGHYYLSIAIELGRQKIRSLIDEKSDSNQIQYLLNSGLVHPLDWEEIRSDEYRLPAYSFKWIVIFFDSSLDSINKLNFESTVISYCESLLIPESIGIPCNLVKSLNYLFSDKCVEFMAFMPTIDEEWAYEFRSKLYQFHNEYVPIISCQGRKFRQLNTVVGTGS